MRKVSSFLTVLMFLGVVAVMFVAETETADAIPAFARKYRMSCTTCHNPVPRLKGYGDDFAGNGFVLQDQDAPRYFVDAGDENLSLIREFPLAVRMDGYLRYESVTDRDVDLTVPYLVKLLSGGSLAKNLAYYFYFYMSERGEVVGVEDAYLMFNNLFDSELDLYVGQFQVSDPLFKREVRLTYDDYQVYKSSVGFSQINLAYDRGLMLTYGFETGTDIIAELINGNGLPESDKYKVYDRDKYKCVVGRISQDVNDYLRVGVFGYWGKEGGNEDTPGTYVEGASNEVWYLGPDLSLTDGKYFELNAQYLERRDSDPLFRCVCNNDIESRGAMAELIWTPEGDRSRYYGVLLFNWLESDMAALDEAVAGTPPAYRYRTVATHLGYLLRTNIRLVTEFGYDLEKEESRFLIGFVSAY